MPQAMADLQVTAALPGPVLLLCLQAMPLGVEPLNPHAYVFRRSAWRR